MEDKLRREVAEQRTAVAKAREAQARADLLLDDSRRKHELLDRELRLRGRYPDITNNFIESLPEPEARAQVGKMEIGEGGGGGVSMKELQNAIAVAKKKAQEQNERVLEQMEHSWQRKLKGAKTKVLELDRELMSLKEMTFKDTGPPDPEDTYMGSDLRNLAAADAANFKGILYGDGMMVMPEDWVRWGTANSDLTRPVTVVSEEGEESDVLSQISSGRAGTSNVEGDEEVGRARKEGLV